MRVVIQRVMSRLKRKVRWLYAFCLVLGGRIDRPVAGKKGEQGRLESVPLLGFYWRCFWRGLKDRALFRNVHAYLMFIGYPRSGHSLLGSLLDAHPEIVIAHEADALRLVQAGFNRQQIYSYLLRNSRMFAASGRGWTGYNYVVSEQWQGRFERLRVIGDKKGGMSTRRLGPDPDLLGQLRKKTGVPVKVIHHIRNPYDNISTICLRANSGVKRPSSVVFDDYFSLCATVARVKKNMPPEDFYETRHELFIRQPEFYLKEICFFLGVGCEEKYLKACAAVVSPGTHKSRHEAEWDEKSIRHVAERMREFEFLAGYSFESE